MKLEKITGLIHFPIVSHETIEHDRNSTQTTDSAGHQGDRNGQWRCRFGFCATFGPLGYLIPAVILRANGGTESASYRSLSPFS